MNFHKKYFTSIFLFAFIICNNCFATNEAIPVLLRVASARQDMSRGYNFVEQLDVLVYKEIIEGRARLWDSPKKEIQISAASLKDIEKSSGTLFAQQPYIFVYENWTKAATEIQTTTIGFSFLNKNQKGEDVAYGFVEFDDLSEALLKNILSVNADGNCNQLMAYSLHAKQFDFNIVQFNGEPVTDDISSEKIKKEFISGFGFNTTLFPQQLQVKCVTYILEHPATIEDAQSKYTNDIINAVQDFLVEHAVTFSDWGSGQLKDVEKPTDIEVTKIEVSEIWNKHAGNITMQLKQIIIYVKGQPLNALSQDDIVNADIECNSKELTEILKEKKMLYYISQVNDQKIERINTFQFLKALKQDDWNVINSNVYKRQ
ncbi:MAG: hypothetical protein ABI723_11400 [Bacteroidia bacterium]